MSAQLISPIFLEAVNGTAFIICLSVAYIFAQYILLGFREAWINQVAAMGEPPRCDGGAGEHKLSFVNWYSIIFFAALIAWYAERKAAMGFVAFIVGEAIMRGAIWWTRHLANDGYDISHLSNMVTVSVAIGLATQVVGGVCLFRHFAPKRWGHWSWMLASGIALAVGIGFAID